MERDGGAPQHAMRTRFHSPISNLSDIPLSKTEETSLWRQPMSDSQWRQVTAGLKSGMAMLDQGSLQSLAWQISEAVQWLDTIMTKYCDITCPGCDDPCCSAGAIFYNQTDMLSLIVMGISPPPGQTRTQPFQPCRYLTSSGCCLQRIARPYVCVWFLCEAQMDLFRDESSSTQRHFVKSLESIRMNRLRIESLYEKLFPNQA
jgi:hypothetical protein